MHTDVLLYWLGWLNLPISAVILHTLHTELYNVTHLEPIRSDEYLAESDWRR